MSGLGAACQVGHVVRDLDQTVRHWTQVLGVGPFFYLPELGTGTIRYNGAPKEISVRIALTYVGTTQMEFIEPRSSGCPYSDFLSGGREGLHHLGFWVADQAETISRLKAQGYDEIVRGDAQEFHGVDFAYLRDHDRPDAILEILAETHAKTAFYQRMADAVAGWDGNDPIRSASSLGSFAAS